MYYFPWILWLKSIMIPFFQAKKNSCLIWARLTSHEWLVKREEDTLPPFFEGFSTHRAFPGITDPRQPLGRYHQKKHFPQLSPPRIRKKFRNRDLQLTFSFPVIFFAQQNPWGEKSSPHTKQSSCCGGSGAQGYHVGIFLPGGLGLGSGGRLSKAPRRSWCRLHGPPARRW